MCKHFPLTFTQALALLLHTKPLIAVVTPTHSTCSVCEIPQRRTRPCLLTARVQEGPFLGRGRSWCQILSSVCTGGGSPAEPGPSFPVGALFSACPFTLLWRPSCSEAFQTDPHILVCAQDESLPIWRNSRFPLAWKGCSGMISRKQLARAYGGDTRVIGVLSSALVLWLSASCSAFSLIHHT